MKRILLALLLVVSLTSTAQIAYTFVSGDSTDVVFNGRTYYRNYLIVYYSTANQLSVREIGTGLNLTQPKSPQSYLINGVFYRDIDSCGRALLPLITPYGAAGQVLWADTMPGSAIATQHQLAVAIANVPTLYTSDGTISAQRHVTITGTLTETKAIHGISDTIKIGSNGEIFQSRKDQDGSVAIIGLDTGASEGKSLIKSYIQDADGSIYGTLVGKLTGVQLLYNAVNGNVAHGAWGSDGIKFGASFPSTNRWGKHWQTATGVDVMCESLLHSNHYSKVHVDTNYVSVASYKGIGEFYTGSSSITPDGTHYLAGTAIRDTFGFFCGVLDATIFGSSASTWLFGNLNTYNLFGDNTGMKIQTPMASYDFTDAGLKYNGYLQTASGGTTGQVLTYNSGSGGTATWQNAGGGGSTDSAVFATKAFTENNFWNLNGNAGTTSGTNFIGTTDGQSLIFKVNNARAAALDRDFGNTVFGVGAFVNTVFDGSSVENVAIGDGAMQQATTSAYSVAIGTSALFNNNATNNVGIGYSALSSNTTGTENTAMGRDAMGDNISGNDNTAIGISALLHNTIGTGNVAIGQASLLSSTTGDYNTGLGGATNIDAGIRGTTVLGYGAFGHWDNGFVLASPNGIDSIHIGFSASACAGCVLMDLAGANNFTAQPITPASIGATWDATMAVGHISTYNAIISNANQHSLSGDSVSGYYTDYNASDGQMDHYVNNKLTASYLNDGTFQLHRTSGGVSVNTSMSFDPGNITDGTSRTRYLVDKNGYEVLSVAGVLPNTSTGDVPLTASNIGAATLNQADSVATANNKAIYQYSAPTTGSTVNSNGAEYLVINPAGALLALTVTFPASPVDGQIFNVSSTQAITTTTFTSSGTIDGNLTGLSANGTAGWIYVIGITSWVKIHN